MEITSVNNELVKDTAKLQQKKYRTETDKFLLEGYKPIKEAFDAGIEIEYVFVLSAKKDDYAFLNDRVILTTEAVLKKISTTDTAPDAVAAAKQKHFESDVLKNAQKVILLENIKDVGNLGTILRTAAAFNADGIVIYGESADIYNPKCVRASTGNIWKVPFVYVDDFSELEKLFKNFTVAATLPRAGKLLKDYEPKTPMLVMFGSEADGLSEELVDFAADKVKIEMSDNVESLNLGVCTAVVMYKLFI